MKRIFILIVIALGLVTTYSFALMTGDKEGRKHMTEEQKGEVMGHGQIMGEMMGLMKHMSEMMENTSEMMTDVSAERMQNMKGLMKEMSEQMIDMSNMMKKGKVSEDKMGLLKDKIKNTQRKISVMMN